MNSEIIHIITYDNYDDFQHVNFKLIWFHKKFDVIDTQFFKLFPIDED
jgi:hypothetical protein